MSTSLAFLLVVLVVSGVSLHGTKLPADKAAPPSDKDVPDTPEKTNIDEKPVVLVNPCTSSPCLNGGECIQTGDTASSYVCRCSPYRIGKNCDQEPVINLSYNKCGATCAASAELPGFPCNLAIDGTTGPDGWQTNGGVGSWIQVDFTGYYRVSGFAIFDRCLTYRQAKQIKVDQSADTTHQFELVCLDQLVACPTDDVKFWHRFDLPSVISNHIRIEYLELCDAAAFDLVGFREIAVFGYDVAMKNVAALSSGATCTASSELDANYACVNALDDVDLPGPGNEWASNGESTGAWIQINLAKNSTVMAVGFLQRCNQVSQNNLLTLSFSDGSSELITLDCMGGGQDDFDCSGKYWQTFDLDPYVVTNFMKVEVSIVCTHGNNGFREIKIFALKDETTIFQ